MSVPISTNHVSLFVMATLAASQMSLLADITATKNDGVLSTVRKNPGDTVTYTNVITNNGPGDATNVSYTDPDDPNAPTNGATVTATAVAVNDTYPGTVLPNVGINTATSSNFSVVTNDFAGVAAGTPVDVTTLTLTYDAVTTNGGSVVMQTTGANIGKFAYTPPPGFTGNDTFTYKLSTASGTDANKTATVTIPVGGPVIWFVNNAGGAGDGRIGSPYNSLSAFNAVNGVAGVANPKANHFVFVYESGTAYTGPVTFLDGQQLIGQDATASIQSIAAASPPADSVALPSSFSGNGTLAKITSSGANHSVILNSANGSNTVRGFTFGSTGTGSSISGTNFGALTLADLSFTDTATRTGQALALNNGSVSGTIANLVASSAVNGIALTSVTGSLTVSAGALSALTGADVLISGGTVNFSYAGTINNTSGRSIDIQSRTSGTVAFSGAITDSGTGILLNNNGTTGFTFSGGITSNTGANTAFAATTNGTLAVTGTNTIGATTPLTTTAINISNTTIAASGVTFKKVSTNGGTNGIVLNTTGSTGGFTITGDGTNTVGGDDSGGVIQNSTGHGIALTNTRGVSLTNVSVQSTGGCGIDGTGVVNFTFANGKVGGSGNAIYESNIAFTNAGSTLGNNLSGTLSITNSTLTNAFYGGIDIGNSSGTITDAVITGNTITSSTSGAASLHYGISLVGTGDLSAAASLTKANISSNTVTNFPSAGGIQLAYGNATAGPASVCGTPSHLTDIVAITNNFIKGESAANPMNTHAITVSISGGSSGNRSTGNFNISNNGSVANPVGNTRGHTVLVGCNGYATVTGTVNSNVIASNNINASNGISGGNGIVTSSAETPDLTLTVNNNTISQTDGNGILLVGRGTTGTAKFKVQNNNVAAPLTGFRPGIRIDAGNSSSVDDAVFLNISGNTSGASGGQPGIGLRKQGTTSTTNDFGIQGLSPSPATGAQMEDFVSTANPNSVLGTSSDGSTQKRTLAISGSNFVSTALVPLMLAEGGIEAETFSPEPTETAVAKTVATIPAEETTDAAAIPAPVAPTQAVGPAVVSQGDLGDSQLQTLVEAAIERWNASGLSAAQLELLRAMRFEVADLPGLRLGEAGEGLIRVDRRAGGNGWFIDSTPLDDEEFSGTTTRRYTQPNLPAAGRMDLLTALLHEMGHALGLDDSYRNEHRDSLMYGYLTKGERRLPEAGQARGAVPHAHPDGHFLTSAISIGTLPAGKSVTVTYSVTISPSINVGQIESQGTVNATLGGSPVTKLTSDSEAGANQKTITLIGVPPAITSGNSATFKVGQAGSFSVTTTGIPTAAITNTGNALPAGVTLTDNGNGTATLGGTTAAGTGNVYNLTFTANNTVAPNATQSFTLTVQEAPTFTSANATTFTTETPGSFTVTTSSYPANAALSLTGGSLPTGVSFADNGNGTGTLSGTPAAGTGGTYVLTFAADNNITPDGSQTFTLTVNQPPAITSANAVAFTEGVPASFTVTTTGFPTGASMAISEQGALPTGVTFTNNNDGTATLAGTAAVGTANPYPLTIKANNGVGTEATQSFTLTVKPPVHHFGVSAPASTVAGTPVNVTVTAYDASNAVVTGYTGTVHFTSTDAQADLPANYTFVAGDNGAHTFSVTLKTAPSQTVSVNDTTTLTATGTSDSVAVTAAAASKVAFGQQPTNTVAGVAISPAVTARILDAFDNLTTSTANVTVAIGTNPSSGTLSGTATVAAVSGVATFSTLSLDKAGTGYTLAASSSGLTGATSSSFNIIPAAATHFAVSAPANAVAGTSFNFTVTALDAFDNTATGYSGTVHFTSSDAPATLPADSTLTNGVGTFASTLKTGGNQTLTAADTVTSSITGTSASILVDPRSDLAATLTDSPDPVTAGTNLTYTIQVTNNGPSTAANVSLSDTLPAGTTFVSLSTPGGWSASAPAVGATGSVSLTKAAVAPAETASFTLVVQVAAAVANGSTITDTVSASTTTAELSSANNSATATTTVSTSADLAVVMTDSPDPAVAGTNVSYSLTVTNNGPSDAANVSVSDTLPAGTTYVSSVPQGGWSTSAPAVGANGTVTFGAAVLPAGGTAQFTLVVKVDASLAAGAVVTNTSVVGATTSDANAANNSATTTTTISRSADLAITMSDSPDPVNATQNVTYTIDVTQNGPSDASTVSVNDTLPANTTFVSVTTPGGWSASTPVVGAAGTITFSKSTFASGQTAQFVIVAKVDLNAPNDSTLTNTALVAATETDPTPGNNSATTTTLVKSGANLALTASGSPEPVVAGTNLTYTIQIQNLGPLDADNVVLQDVLPTGTTFVSLASPGGWGSVTPSVGANGTVTVSTASLANGATATFTVVAKIAAGTAAGSTLTNTPSVSSDTIDIVPGNNSQSVVSNVTRQSDLAIGLARTPNPAAKGANVTYTLTVDNHGPSDADSVTVTNPLPATMTFVSASAASGWSASTPAVGSGGTVTFSRASFATGGTATFTIVAKVKTDTATGTNIIATATVGLATSATISDPNTANNSASATTAVGTVDPTPLQLATTATLNRQSGLFELSVDVTNTTPLPINGFRLHVNFSAYLAAYPSLRLYNASGTTGGGNAYIDYPYPVAIDGKVTVKLMFYTSTRTFPSPFSPVLTVETLPTSQVADTNGAGVQPKITKLANGTVRLEFDSVAGHWYRVRYSSDMVHWFDSPVPLQAGGSKTQWIDDGAPFTNVSPADPSVTSRFYLVNEITAP